MKTHRRHPTQPQPAHGLLGHMCCYTKAELVPFSLLKPKEKLHSPGKKPFTRNMDLAAGFSRVPCSRPGGAQGRCIMIFHLSARLAGLSSDLICLNSAQAHAAVPACEDLPARISAMEPQSWQHSCPGEISRQAAAGGQLRRKAPPLLLLRSCYLKWH